MNQIYTIETNKGLINFHYVSKRLANNVTSVNLTMTESKFLLKLCQHRTQGVLVTSRSDMETSIWENDPLGIDRKPNLNQLVCTLRKKLSLFTLSPFIITQPKKGYSLDDSIRVELLEPEKVKREEPKKTESIYTAVGFLRPYWVSMGVMIGLLFNSYFLFATNISPPVDITTIEKIANGTSVIIGMNTDKIMTVNCVNNSQESAKFVNYFIHDLKKKDINYSWRTKVCGKL